MNLRRVISSRGFEISRLWRAWLSILVRAPFSFLAMTRRLYIKERWRLRSSASRTLCLSFWDGRVKTCICRRSASGMVHQGRRRVPRLVPIERAGSVTVGFAVCMTECIGREAISPTSTRIVCVGGSVSKFQSASLAAAPAMSSPRMFVCALILCRVMRMHEFRSPGVPLCFIRGACGGGSADICLYQDW